MHSARRLLAFLATFPVTIAISLVAILASTSPGLTDSLQLNWNHVLNGEWWRIATGHAVHYGTQHLGWDLLMFITLGAACERAHRGLYATGLVLMATGISTALYLWCPAITMYRGLSGLDTGLFLWFVADQTRRCWTGQNRWTALLWTIPAIGLVGKLIFEAATGQTLFVESDHFIPLVEAHLAGAVMGLMLFVISIRPERQTTPVPGDPATRSTGEPDPGVVHVS